jgi:ABC-2 type transport system ATP-binding protein
MTPNPRLRRRPWIALTVASALTASVIALAGASAATTTAAASESAQPFAVTSFDGTTITGDYFQSPAGRSAPTVLFGPGWGGEAISDPTTPSDPANGTIGVAPLLAAGYNVVSWNPRGFHTSTGRAEADSAFYEGRDVSAILDWVARQRWAELDRRGDPRVGMVGGSYGGEVQWAAAAVDHRIDAIAPDISWNSLVTSLAPNRTNKTAWSALLSGGAQLSGQRNDPRVDTSFAAAQTSFEPTADAVRFLGARGRHDLAARVHVPTLILQGTVDTLFPLDEAAVNYREVSRNHVPVKMVWFCGGHGVCLTDPGDTTVVERETLTWLDRYVKGERVSTGPGFEWVDQLGTWHTARTYRPHHTGVSAHGAGTLSLSAAGGSGPGPAQLGPYASVVATRATNAVNVPIRFPRTTSVLGAPTVSITYKGTAPKAAARVLAQVVDEHTGVVLGNQLTPIPVRLDGRTHTARVPLEYVAAVGTRQAGFTLQLVAQSSQINTYPTGGSVRFARVHVTLPTRCHRQHGQHRAHDS